jgi:hypothetical protein
MHVEKVVANLLVGHLEVLVSDKPEELVLDDGTAECAPQNVAMQLGIFHVGWYVRVLLEEEWSCVDPVGSAVAIKRAGR